MLPLLPTDGRQATGVLPRVTRNATMNHSQLNCAFNHKTTHDLIPRLVYADPARLPFPCSTKVVLNSGVLQPLDRVLGAGRHLLALINAFGIFTSFRTPDSAPFLAQPTMERRTARRMSLETRCRVRDPDALSVACQRRYRFEERSHSRRPLTNASQNLR